MNVKATCHISCSIVVCFWVHCCIWISQLNFSSSFLVGSGPSFQVSRNSDSLKTVPNKDAPHRSRLTTTKLHENLESVEVQAEKWMKSSIASPDSVRRRQIIFSLLTASGALQIQPDAALADGDDMVTEEMSDTDPFSTLISEPIKDIVSPPLDDREYEAFVLDNGLRVLLCSDPSSNEAAGAMDVHVGACSDPDDVPGLAHFVEHMLFLGTKDYPKEESFSSFLTANGGTSNAFTDSENTVYYFNMEAEADSKLKEGLDRFGSFFSSPLFTVGATDRELNAINSENAKNLQSDVFRYYQIQKSRASSKHPFSKFFTGNRKTLLDETRKKGINLREELVKFYETYYSANQMTLAVVAPQSISTLKKMVTDSFSGIPNRNIPKPEEAWKDVPPYNGDSVIPSFQNLVQMVPVQDLRQISLTWPITYASEKDRQLAHLVKQDIYVCHLLGHEGPGSLLSYLKRLGWANSLACSTEKELSDFETFDITVELTRQGLAAAKDVTGAIFTYISMLRNQPIPEYVFQEVLQLQELNWRFLTKTSPGGYVTSLATAMQIFPPPLYVAGPRRLSLTESRSELIKSSEPRTSFSSMEQEELAKELAMDLIEKLTPENVLLTVVSKSFEKEADQVEKWYGTKYRARRISAPTLARMRNPFSPRELGIAYPKPNPFIPSEDGLRVKRPPAIDVDKSSKRSFESRMKPVTPPRIIRDDGSEGRWTVHFKEDDRFGQPKAYLIFQLLTKEVYSSATSAALAQLYQACAADRLEEYAYDAQLAGLSFDVQVLPRGVRLTFGGYNDKLGDFATYVTKKLTNDTRNSILPKKDVEFDRYKDNVMRALSSFDVKQPYAHASYYSYLTLKPEAFEFTNTELRNALRKTTLPDLISYVESLWSSGKGEALVQGNLDEEEALALVDTVDSTLGFKTIPDSEIPPRIRALPLPQKPEGTHLKVEEPNLSNENSATHVVFQSLGRNEKDHVLIELLSAIIQDPYYDDLRTKQQLGYIVGAGIRALEETRTLAFTVQSSVAPAEKLTEAVLKFLDTFEQETLQPLNEGDIAVYVKSLIDRKTEPDKTLATEVTRNWSEIARGCFEFDRVQREAAALLEVKKADVIEFWRSLYGSDGRRMLISEIIPRNGDASSAQPPRNAGYKSELLVEDSAKINLGIDDIQLFRKDRQPFA